MQARGIRLIVAVAITTAALLMGVQQTPRYFSVAPAGHYLIDPKGKPFFWLGDTAWLLCQRTRREDVDLYLRTRAKQGFTVIQAAAVMAEERVGGGVTRPNAYGDLAFIEGDLARPKLSHGNNPDVTQEYYYWDHVDYVINTAEANGLVIGLLPLFISFREEGYKYLGSTTAYAYGRFLGERYRAKSNLIWILGGDDIPNTDSKRTVWDLLAKGITEGVAGSEDYSRTLMTYHISGGNSSSQWLHRVPWLDFNMVQTWSRHEEIYPMVHADYDLVPHKPCGLGEGAYENGPQYPTKPINALMIRKQAYWSYLAGGYHTFGNTDTWNLGTFTDEATQDWKQALHSPGATHLTVLKKFFAFIEWWKFVPDQSIFARGVGSGNTLNAAMRSIDGDSMIAYLSGSTTVSLYMNKITVSDCSSATWVDPKTGAQVVVGDFASHATQSFTTPASWEDAVLYVKACGEKSEVKAKGQGPEPTE